MGIFCSCFRGAEPDDESVDSDDNEQVQGSSNVVNRNGNAQDNFALFLHNLTNKCEAVLGKRGTEAGPWSYQGASSSQTAIPQVGSQTAIPQVGSYGSSSSSSGSGSGISLVRHGKGSNRSRVEPEPFCESNFESVPSEDGSKKYHPEMPPFEKLIKNLNTISQNDEDICPICLEEYTFEDPRIVTKCSHHYHLGCIYEWNERSETCPVCSQLMVFEEMD